MYWGTYCSTHARSNGLMIVGAGASAVAGAGVVVGGVERGGADENGSVNEGLVVDIVIPEFPDGLDLCCEAAGGKVSEPGMLDMLFKTLFCIVEEVLIRPLLLIEVDVVDDEDRGAREHTSSLPSTSTPRFWLTRTLHCPKAAIGTPLDSTLGPPLTREYAYPWIRL